MTRVALRTAVMAVIFAAAQPLQAQGGISIQGLGYPGGELSTRALGTGGSIADFDANSPLNPAALLVGTRATVYIQYDPEFRWLEGPGLKTSTVTARFPLFVLSGRIGKARFSLSYANYLDRTWTNTYSDTQVIGGTSIPSNVTAVSTGGISDAQAAMSYTFSQQLTLGVGIHEFIGGNSVIFGRAYPSDSLDYGAFAQTNTYNINGSAVSFGVLATPFSHINFAASARIGFTMRVHQGDSTVLGEGKVPNRFSFSVAYDGVPGSILSARWSKENWSAMNGLSQGGFTALDATDESVGLETGGPRFNGVPMSVRLGFRDRQLPFAVGTNQVTEQSLMGGLGIPLSQGRAALDITLAHAKRTAPNLVLTETGWILSVGVSIKPYF